MQQNKPEYVLVWETALALHNTGLQIGRNISVENFERLIILIQYQKELHAEKLASKNKQEKIIVCDRGILDNLAYSGNELFFKILDEYGMDIDNIVHSYDKVIYLKSMAQTDPEILKKSRNPQKLERAVTLSDLILKGWGKYQEDIIQIEATEKLKDKLKQTRNHIKDVSPKSDRQKLKVISDEVINDYINKIFEEEQLPYKICRNVRRTLARK